MQSIGPGIDGTLSFDIRGKKQYTCSQIIKNILDRYYTEKNKDETQEFILDNQMVFDPYLNIYANEESKSALLKTCLDSCFGYMYRLPDGRIRLGTYLPPSTIPNFEIGETLIDSDFISELNTVNPYWQIQIGYDKNYTIQSEDKISPLVSIPNRRRYSKPYIYHVLSDRKLFEKYPDSGILKIDTFLGNRSDSVKLTELIYSLFKYKLTFYQLDSIRNFGKILEPGQTMRVHSNTFYTTTYKDIMIKKASYNSKSDTWQVLGYSI
jgi:hypothetical protein